MTRRLRVLAGHPHLGQPNDVVREFQNAQAYVDAGFAEWINDSKSPETEVVVGRSAPVEATVTGGAVETTSARAPVKPPTGGAGVTSTPQRRGVNK